MKIRNKIILVSMAIFLWAVLFGAVASVAIHDARHYISRHEQLEEARTLLRQLNVLTFDYLLFATERAAQQWEQVYAELVPALSKVRLKDHGEEEDSLKKLLRRLPYTAALFREILESRKESLLSATSTSGLFRKKYGDRLAEQLMLENQRIFASVTRFQEISYKEQQQLYILIIQLSVFFIAVIGIGALILYFGVHRAIVRPLLRLQKSAAKIAAGEWDYPLDVNQADEIGDLARGFKTMAGSLRERMDELLREVLARRKAEGAKDDLVRTVSHELRTPLSILKEGISLLNDDMAGNLDGEQKEILRVAMRNADRLSHIINDLLDISRIEAGKMKLEKERFNIAEVAGRVITDLEKAARDKGLRIVPEFPGEPVLIHADPAAIERVFMNLIGNAVKFTQSGSVTVSVRSTPEEVECCVSDTGIGIDPGNLPRLFDKFCQFDRKAGSGEKGTGLGLSITQGILKMHRGRIWVESQPGRGSKFYFSLPQISPE